MSYVINREAEQPAFKMTLTQRQHRAKWIIERHFRINRTMPDGRTLSYDMGVERLRSGRDIMGQLAERGAMILHHEKVSTAPDGEPLYFVPMEAIGWGI